MARGAVESILALKPSSLGDIVHALPAVARLKAARPEARISWLVNTEWAPLLEGNPDLDEVIVFPRREFRGPASWPKLAGWVRRHLAGRRPELAVDFQGLLRTALLARSSGAREIVGATDAREGAGLLYHRRIAMPGGVPHAVERYLALAGGAVGELSSEPLRFPLPAGEWPSGVGELGEFVLIHPFSRGEGKSLGVEQVRVLCQCLAPRRAVIVGRWDGEPLGPASGAVDLLNATNLSELIGLIRRARFVISVDSGPMHLAAALNRPLVGIHTWSDPRKVGPYRPDAWIWKGGRLLQMRDLTTAPDALFAGGTVSLGQGDLEGICRIAAI